MPKNLTPEHMRCGASECNSIHLLDDGRLLIVGQDGHAESVKHQIHGSMDERAIIIDPALLKDYIASVRSKKNG